MLDQIKSYDQALFLFGVFLCFTTVLSLICSIVFPKWRLWPPRRYNIVLSLFMWTKTFLIYGIILVLGVVEWGEIDVYAILRFGLGGALFLIGNVIVWREVFRFGYDQTSGRQGKLIISGFYKYSRNPQYVGDIMLLTGWAIISSAPYAIVLVGLVCATLVLAPFAEEPWLETTYGSRYLEYKARVRRFL